MPTRISKPPPPPVDPFIVTHLHPALILSSYALQFRRIVANPDSALLSSLFPLVLIQAVYIAICLDNPPPPSDGSSKKASRFGRKTDSSVSGSWMGDKILPTSLSLVFALTVGAFVINILLVLFGAPFTTHHRSTFLCSAHMSMLSVFPLVYAHGLDGQKWRDIIAVTLPLDEVFAAAVGAMVGAWLGAVPTPLDWDREWQKWPVTILTGAYLGYTLGKLGGMYLFNGKKLIF